MDTLLKFTHREEHDCLYGNIILPDILWMIIESNEFQRLRRIKQLGGVEYICKDATHNRYQHSIGTAYLAGLMASRLQLQGHSPSIDDKDKLCVQIAALCHDLGHGPFSFVFRKKVLPQLEIDSFKHKKVAFKIFEKIWKKLEENYEKAKDVLQPRDMRFIEELIKGTSKSPKSPVRLGRGDGKRILYNIFCNDAIEVDLCKFDYMARDILSFGDFKTTMIREIRSIIEDGLVHKDPTGNFRPHEKLITNMNELHDLHRDRYQSDPVNAVEHMIADAIVYAVKNLKLSSNIQKQDIDCFCRLDDHILSTIRYSTEIENPLIVAAKNILDRLENGQFYDLASIMTINKWDSKTVVERIVKENPGISPKDIRVSILRHRATDGDINVDQSKIQVFCVDPDKTRAVRKACQILQK